MITGIKRATGKSRLRVPRGVCMPEIAIAAASIKATLTTLLPKASPREICGVPASAALIATANSGLEVANAAMVAPIFPAKPAPSGRCRWCREEIARRQLPHKQRPE